MKSRVQGRLQIFSEEAEADSAQTKQAAANLMDSYSMAARRVQDYNAKFIEFAQTNTEATLAFVQDLTKVKTPTEFFELSTIQSRKQFETFTEQVRELATLAQKVALATAVRAETDVNKAYSPS
jgi:hypothetical protein